MFLISNLRRVLNVVYFLLGDSPASEIYMPTFRDTVPKRRHINFSRRGITQKKAYYIYVAYLSTPHLST